MTFLKGVIIMTGTMRRLILATIAVFLLAGPAVAGSMKEKTNDQSMQKHEDTIKKEENKMMEKGEMKKDSDEMMKDESMGRKEKMEMKELHEKKGM
jgi:sensor c-di-GMP phosphodiesterase-like protein